MSSYLEFRSGISIAVGAHDRVAARSEAADLASSGKRGCAHPPERLVTRRTRISIQPAGSMSSARCRRWGSQRPPRY